MMKQLILKLSCAFILLFQITNVYSENGMTLEEFENLDFKQKILLITQEADEELQKAILLMNDQKDEEAIKKLKNITNVAPFLPQAYILQLRYFQKKNMEDKIYQVLEDAGKNSTDFDNIFQALRFDAMGERKIVEDSAVRLADFKDDKDSAVSFNFDDGPLSVATKVLPIFDEFGYKATIPVNPVVVTDTYTNPAWGSWEDWKKASHRGHEISNHAYRHRKLTEVLPENWDHEINGSFAIIKDKIGKPPLSFVFPHDNFNNELIQKVKERHWAIRVHDVLTEVYPHVYIPVYGGKYFSLNTANQIVDLAMKRKLWLVPECHAVYSEEIRTYKPLTVEFLRSHLQYIKQHEDRIWVDTFINVYSYLMERKRSEIEFVKNSESSLIVKVKTDLEPERIHIPLTVVIDVSPEIPKRISAVQGSQIKKKLHFKIVKTKILIDVLPGSEPVLVSWTY